MKRLYFVYEIDHQIYPDGKVEIGITQEDKINHRIEYILPSTDITVSIIDTIFDGMKHNLMEYIKNTTITGAEE